ncbi:hypothetical protein HZA96_05910 [Candidatus Woesearchaeota archaeon]|nr:hypothetical protein [Candidatus Woesearchaeota archaeon]
MKKTKSGKKQLSEQQEFEIMKLVLDKFLWLGFGIMALGFYAVVLGEQSVSKGVTFLISGAVLLVLFLILIVREYEIIK